MSADPLAPAVRQLFAALTHAGGPTSEAFSAAEASTAAAPCAATGASAAARAPAATRPQDDHSLWVSGEAGRERHGTRVRFMLRLQGRRLREVRYRAYGCPHTLAACEWLARRLEGGQIGERPGAPADWAQQLQIPPAKLGRLLVVEDALMAALAAADKSVTDS